MAIQRELFRLPRPEPQLPVTPAQLTLLDWLTLGDGRLPAKFDRQVLRGLLRKGWVKQIVGTPVYRVTPYGQAVRGRRQVSRETLARHEAVTSSESGDDAGV
jgi:hypothetical protein